MFEKKKKIYILDFCADILNILTRFFKVYFLNWMMNIVFNKVTKFTNTSSKVITKDKKIVKNWPKPHKKPIFTQR